MSTLTPYLCVADARSAIDWYQRACGFTVAIVVDAPDGSVMHSELRYGEAIVMVTEGNAEREGRFGIVGRAPRATGGVNAQTLFLYVDDVDSHHTRAREAGYLVNAVAPDALRLAPPLVLGPDEVASFLAALPGILDGAEQA